MTTQKTRIGREVKFTLHNKEIRIAVKTTVKTLNGKKVININVTESHVLTAKQQKHGVSYQSVALSTELSFLTGKLEGLYAEKLSDLVMLLQGQRNCTRYAMASDGTFVSYKSVAGVGSSKLYKLAGSKFAQAHNTVQDAKMACLKFLLAEHPNDADALMTKVCSEGFEVELSKELTKDEMRPVWQILGEDKPEVVVIVEL